MLSSPLHAPFPGRRYVPSSSYRLSWGFIGKDGGTAGGGLILRTTLEGMLLCHTAIFIGVTAPHG